MKISGLAEQFAPVVDHRFHEFVADFGRAGHACREGLIFAADELHD
jgi:hypothetical protein